MFVVLGSRGGGGGAEARPRAGSQTCRRCSASTRWPGAGTALEDADVHPQRRVAEDPATGSAAGPLAVHLARHGRIAFGDEIEITQGVEISRPSKLYARVDGSADRIERVEVGGSAVVVARGEFQL